MAKKKFSRLSVMLEAKDRMSKPMQNAANSSKKLQNSVKQLGSSLDKSRNSVVNASVANRVLAEKYQDLGKKMTQTDEKIKRSTRLFQSLPKPIKMAAYTVEGYSRALYDLVQKSTLARISTKILSTTLKMTAHYISNVTDKLKLATSRLWDFSRAAKIIKAIQHPFKVTALHAKNLAENLKLAAKATYSYKLLSIAVKMTGESISSAYQKQKKFIKDIPGVVRGTKAWHLYSYAVAKTKEKIVATSLALTLFKNSNKTIERMSQTFGKIGDAVSRLLPKFNGLRNNIAGADKALGKFSSRRSTFNQLADANARLNKEIMKMNRELSKANSRLGNMRSQLGSINGMGAAFTAAYTGSAAAQGGGQLLESTVGRSMEQDYSSQSVGILAGAENGAKFYKQIQDYAASTVYSTEDWARNMRGAISKSTNVKDLETYQMAIEQLATLDPIQGLDGAALAIRELNSGDIVSLVERFELPRKALKGIKDIEDPIEQINELMKLVGENTGFTTKAISEMKELPLMQWQKMVNLSKTMLGYIGAPAMKALAPIFERINAAIDAGKFDGFVAKLGGALKTAILGVINFVTTIYNAFQSGELQAKFQPMIDLFINIKDTIVEAWPTIAATMESAKNILNKVAEDINALWPTANGYLQDALTLVKDIANWIDENWTGLSATIVGVSAAFATLRIISGITFLWQGLTAAIALYRNGTLLATAAQWLLNTALFANPIGLVIAIVVGLAAAFYVLYQKSETFRNAIQKLGDWVLKTGIQALIWLAEKAVGVRDGFKAVGEWISDALGKLGEFIALAKNFKMPDFGVPKWLGGEGFIKPSGGGGSKGHHGGLNNVPYNGYTARLHQGERVLTKQENKQMSNGGSGGVVITGNNFTVREEADIDKIGQSLFDKLYAAQQAM